MRFYYIVCNSIKFKDDFVYAMMSQFIRPGGIYRCFEDDSKVKYLFVDDMGVDRCVLLGEKLIGTSDPRYNFEFYELNLENFYKNKGVPFIIDSYALMEEWVDKKQSPFSPRPLERHPDPVDEAFEDAEEDLYIEDVDFILQNYDDMYNISMYLQEGFIRSIDMISQIKENVSPPFDMEMARDNFFSYVEEFNQTRDMHSLGLAQLMLYYIFGLKE